MNPVTSWVFTLSTFNQYIDTFDRYLNNWLELMFRFFEFKCYIHSTGGLGIHILMTQKKIIFCATINCEFREMRDCLN